jgi:hypothetical protein
LWSRNHKRPSCMHEKQPSRCPSLPSLVPWVSC